MIERKKSIILIKKRKIKKKNKIQLGILEGKAKVIFKKGFKMTVEEFLNF